MFGRAQDARQAAHRHELARQVHLERIDDGGARERVALEVAARVGEAVYMPLPRLRGAVVVGVQIGDLADGEELRQVVLGEGANHAGSSSKGRWVGRSRFVFSTIVVSVRSTPSKTHSRSKKPSKSFVLATRTLAM